MDTNDLLASLPDVTRRRFLQVTGGTAGAAMLAQMLPFGQLSAWADPLPPGAPVLVSVFLGGGLDGAHMLVPAGAGYGAYDDKRGNISVPEASLLSLSSTENGLNPLMPKLHARYQAGDVAFARGVDLLSSSGFEALSHFDKTDYVMLGRNAPPPQRNGVWARWADTQPDNPLLMATVDFGMPVLFTGGAKQQAAALPTYLGDALGANPSFEEQALIDALLALDADYVPADLSLPSRVAHAGGFALRTTADLASAYPADTDGIDGSMGIIAALINANITGTQVYATVQGGYDTHSNQLADLGRLFPRLDDAIDEFFAALVDPSNVVVMVWTEFGRTAHSNPNGTDHGKANNVVLAGPRVTGGLYGAQPGFAPAELADGYLVPTTDFGSVYGEIITDFLGGDATAIYGAAHAPLGMLT